MPASAKVSAALLLTAPSPAGTANIAEQKLSADIASLTALTNTIGQISFFVTDALTGDDQTAELRLMATEQAVTADASTDKITLASHGFVAAQAIQFTGTAAPGGLTFNTTYYVRDTTTNDFKVAATVGGAAIDLSSAGTSVKVRAFNASITLAYAYHQPTVPVQVRDSVTGEVNDFTKIRAIQVILRALDTAANASASAALTMGDTSDRYGHFNLPLKLAFTAAGAENWPTWLGSLPEGLAYNTTYHLTLRIKQGESNTNGLVLINLLGN